jgi:hypothetical protein
VTAFGSPAVLILLANSHERLFGLDLGKTELAGQGKTAVPDAPHEFASSISFDDPRPQPGRRPLFFRGLSVVPARRTIVFIKIAGDPSFY